MDAKDIKAVVTFDSSKIKKLIERAKGHNQQLIKDMKDIKGSLLK